jgi:tetratricopeptide (TPR) repeat protein
MADDWFRRKTWTEADRKEFFVRLQRSRGADRKAQYLRIQAVELLSTPTSEGVAAAFELTEILLRDYPERSELALAHKIRGECFEANGKFCEAIEEYRHSMQAQRDYPNSLTGVHLSFACLIAIKELRDQYQEALSVLAEFGKRDDFLPYLQYQSCGARALIYSRIGDHTAARHWAELALQAASAQHSGLRYHPKLGLVAEIDRQLHARLTEIASSEKAKAK